VAGHALTLNKNKVAGGLVRLSGEKGKGNLLSDSVLQRVQERTTVGRGGCVALGNGIRMEMVSRGSWAKEAR
jgi:hypothetical protein